MRAYEVGDFATTGKLTLTERPVPRPERGEALVRIHATGLNARDISIMRRDFFGAEIPESHIPLSDMAGRVVAVGAGVQEVQPGDRVTMTHYWRWLSGSWDESMRAEDYSMNRDGFLVEQACVPAAALVKLPPTIGFVAASTLQSAGLTAWNAVVEHGRIGPGKTAVTLGTGGVSLFAMQWAKMLGAKAIVTSSSDEKLARVCELGADAGVNYARDPNWPEKVMELTEGLGADLVVNNVGVTELDRCLEVCASGAQIMHVGANPVTRDRKPVSAKAPTRLGLMIMRDLTLKGIIVGSRAMFVRLIDTLVERQIEPIIDRVYEFEETNEAIARMLSGDKIGKIAIRVAADD